MTSVNWKGSQHALKQEITISIVLMTFLSVLLRGVERLLAAAVSAVDVDGRLCSVTVVCDFGAASKCAEIIFQYEKTKKHRGMRKRQNTTKHQSDTPATMLI